jgi:transcription elongation factor SPT6
MYSGVDVNLAVMYPHKAHTLQFVCGLGPRKAPTMLNKISRISNGGRLESREMLVKKGICSKQIFMNSASFLRIKAVHFQRRQGEESLLDVLDDTRIHPEDYGLARKMAADSIEVDEELDEEENPSLHVQDLMEGDVNRLDSLLLDDYADELERRLGEPKRIALNEIKDELKQPYRERRRRFTPPSVDRVFTMLTGMTDETLRRDMLIACRVERVTDRVVRVVVGSGLDGFIYAKNLSDNGSMGQTPADHGVYEGKVLKCRVVEVQKDKLSVELSARPSEVEYGANEEVRRDECFDYKCEKKDAMEREAKVRSVVVGRKEISVSHPKFVKCGSEEAERMMEGKEVGWYLLRPSGKGPRHLSVTWKVAVGRACHLDVVDMGGGGKMGWSIDNRKFGELDELLVVYLDPLIRNVREVLECAKFSGRERNAMLGVLKGDTETFRKSSYGICGSEDPLKFYFCYCNVGGRGKYDHLIVRPEGFMFRERVYGRVSEVIVGFKKGEERRARERSAGRGGGRNGEARSGARPDERRRR